MQPFLFRLNYRTGPDGDTSPPVGNRLPWLICVNQPFIKIIYKKDNLSLILLTNAARRKLSSDVYDCCCETTFFTKHGLPVFEDQLAYKELFLTLYPPLFKFISGICQIKTCCRGNYF